MMSRLKYYRVWLLAAASLLSAPAWAVTLQCADADELASCTPLAIWASFRDGYRDESEDWIDSYLSRAEQVELAALLESGRVPTAAKGGWEAKLPPAAAIVLQWLSGKLSAVAVAEAARLLEAEQDRAAVLTTLTLLAHDSALAAAMTWTLNSPPERMITLGWMLSAGNSDARDWAANLLLQCSRDGTGCADDLPAGPLLSPEQLPGMWPKLSPEYRVAALASMPIDGLESFLRRELLAEGSADTLYRAWALAAALQSPYPETRAFLARLIMERLLDPRALQEARFQRPIDAPLTVGAAATFDRLEVRAWEYLVALRAAESLQLWRAQSRSRNPWVALLGVAALVASDRESEVNDQLATLTDAQGAPAPELLKLLEQVDSAAVDQLYLRMFSKPPADIRLACAEITGITSERAERLAPELGRWAQRVLSSVPVSELPPLQQLKLGVSADSWPEPMRSAACVTGAVMRVSKARAADLKPLAAYLASHEALVYKLIGAVLSLQWDDLAPMERLLDLLSTATDPVLKQMHREMADDFVGVKRRAAVKGSGASVLTALCEESMASSGVDPDSLDPAEWSVEQTGAKQQRLTLSTTTLTGERLSVVCEVESDPDPRVMMLQFPF